MLLSGPAELGWVGIREQHPYFREGLLLRLAQLTQVRARAAAVLL
jgi:hypothetical protein